MPKYSIVVPFHNEQESVTTLYDRLKAVMEATGESFELVFVDDGSTDRTYKLLREIVTTGHSAPIRATKVLAAGKTGTSSRTSDVWFVGYTSRWMATAWLGD